MLLSNKIYSLMLGFILLSSASVFAQNTQTPAEKEAAYTKVITQRADKIVAALSVADSSKAKKVSKIITQQYRSLNDIYNDRDAQVKAIKVKGASKEATDAALKEVETKTTGKLDKLHKHYLKSLSKYLTEEQVVKVKDGMTYNVLPITYTAYMDMLPNLTEPQKKQIMEWLLEAREHAMDAESSDKKHAWFGKYKGKINNYLSAAGIDMKQEGIEWQKRIEAAAKK